MCGIVGFIRLNPANTKKFTAGQLKKALTESSWRGNEAVGVFSPETGAVKESGGVENFFKKHDMGAFSGVKIFIGHTRAASRNLEAFATAAKNENNHPHEGEKYVVIHNGHFSLKRLKDYKYNGECDTETFLSYVETFGVEKALKNCLKVDKYAVVIYEKATGHVYFYRHDNPIVYAFEDETESMIWGSTANIIGELAWEVIPPGFGPRLKGLSYRCPWMMYEDELYMYDGELVGFVKSIKPAMFASDQDRATKSQQVEDIPIIVPRRGSFQERDTTHMGRPMVWLGVEPSGLPKFSHPIYRNQPQQEMTYVD